MRQVLAKNSTYSSTKQRQDSPFAPSASSEIRSGKSDQGKATNDKSNLQLEACYKRTLLNTRIQGIGFKHYSNLCTVRHDIYTPERHAPLCHPVYPIPPI